MKTKSSFSAFGWAGLLCASLLLQNCGNAGQNKSDAKILTEQSRHSNTKKDVQEATSSDTGVRINTQPIEEKTQIQENSFKDTQKDPLSTFSIDVDKASYSQVRAYLNQNQLPPSDAIRIEEMVNYFNYDYPQPIDGKPFSINTEVSVCPWKPENKLVHIGLQGKKLNYDEIKPSNLVFLIDISGSMSDENKLPLLKKSFKILLKKLSAKDKVAIVVYAGKEGVVLPATPANEQDKIIDAFDDLQSGGSTAGGAGIELAYKIAEANYISGGNNRVILATDGDFNVGVSSTEGLVNLIEQKRQKDIYLTICGFGMGNYQDHNMEELSRNGNGNYFYIDNLKEAEKVFSREMTANLFTIAKDVKIQIEFNIKNVKSYRLIGYENRVMANEDFKNDKKDAGELGAGHTVTALYEVVLQNPNTQNQELMTANLRYKPLKQETSLLLSQTIKDKGTDLSAASENFRFSAAVATFGMLLRNSSHKGKANYALVEKLAGESVGKDENGDRYEFLKLVKKAQQTPQ